MPVQRDSVATVSTERHKYYASLPKRNSNNCQWSENPNFLQVSINTQKHTDQTSVVHQHLIDLNLFNFVMVILISFKTKSGKQVLATCVNSSQAKDDLYEFSFKILTFFTKIIEVQLNAANTCMSVVCGHPSRWCRFSGKPDRSSSIPLWNLRWGAQTNNTSLKCTVVSALMTVVQSTEGVQKRGT